MPIERHCAVTLPAKKSGRQRSISVAICPVVSLTRCTLSMPAITCWVFDSCNTGETAAVENGTALRVVVVGAGIVGASIAYHLARRHVAVTVLEHHQPGAGASSHSFAWLNAFGKEPFPYHDLNRRSLEVWHRFAQALQADIGLHWGGEMRWVHTPEDAQVLQQRLQQLQTWGYPNRLITAAELCQLEPGLVPGPVSAASLGPID